MSSGKTLIKVWPSGKPHPSILMSIPVNTNPSHQQILVAEVNPVYLWGIGTKKTLPPDVEYMVFQEANNFLISSIQDIQLDGKNLEFIICLRNKIEHRNFPELDPALYGECQSMLMNFEGLLVKEFGEKYALAETLSVSLQFSALRPEAQERAIKKPLGNISSFQARQRADPF